MIATGVTPRLPNVPGQDVEGVFCLRDLSDAIAIKRFIIENQVKRASVIGAGLIALEMCEAFKTLGLETTMIYRRDLPMRNLGEDFGQRILKVLEGNDVKFVPGREIVGFEAQSGNMAP